MPAYTQNMGWRLGSSSNNKIVLIIIKRGKYKGV